MRLLNFIKLTKVIYVNTIDFLEEDFLEQKEKTEFLIELCDKYRNRNKRYYNLPLPEDIIRKYDNEIGYDNYNNINYLEFYKEELNFYKHVAEHYDNNDFIITEEHLYEGLYDANQLEKFYISPEVRRRVHGICKELEESIEKLKSKKK